MRFTQAQLAAIKALEDSQGRLTPGKLVKAARDKRSPLHKLFDWNVKQAAELWWLQRARVIIGAVEVQYQTKEYAYKGAGYVRDTSASGQGYRSVVALQTDPVSARESLIYTLEVAAGHVRRAVDLAGPLGLSHEIDALLEQIVGVQRVIQRAA